MSTVPITYLTPEQYLELDRASDTKHEYWYGEVFAMAGGSPPHSYVINRIQTALTNRLEDRDCGVFNADLRVSVRWDTLIAYPDVTVVCGEPKYVGVRPRSLRLCLSDGDVVEFHLAEGESADRTVLCRLRTSTRI